MSSPNDQRNRACRLARTDTVQSLELARAIDQPWYRCQALSYVARFAPDQRVVPIAEESVRAGKACTEGYHCVASVAWPVRALIERDHLDPAMKFVREAVEASRSIGHPVCRLDALELLWMAVFPAGVASRERTQSALVDACTSAKSWKAGRCLTHMVELLATDDPAAAARIARLLATGRYRSRADRALRAQTAIASVRSFFH